MTKTGAAETLASCPKIAYGIGELCNSVGPGTIILFWYSLFLTDIVRMAVSIVPAILLALSIVVA